MIKKITITNIKGIGSNAANGIFTFDIPKNKPSIFVAPNGFGKSSLATAFSSLKKSKIDLKKNDYYLDKKENVPIIEISYLDTDGCDQTVKATNLMNDINKVFDCFVINSQVFAKSKKINIGPTVIASASLETPPVILSNSIPERLVFKYCLASQKTKIGKNGKVLTSISSFYSDQALIKKLNDYVSVLDKISGKRIQTNLYNFIKRLNLQNGSKKVLLDWIYNNEIDFLSKIDPLRKVASFLNNLDLKFSNVSESYLAAFQISNDYDKDPSRFKQAIKSSIYELEKKNYKRIFKDFNSSWKDFKPKEKNGKLIVEIPKTHHISNGQRDVMCFIALLKKAEMMLNKNKCILFIDELFDYLDDANLIAVQYYITQLIAKFKKENRMFYPIILTHLDPSYFKNFTFSKQKVFYLNKKAAKISEHLKKLLRARDNDEIKINISKYYLHYEPSSININQDFKKLKLNPAWGCSGTFAKYISTEFAKYLNDNDAYDPFAVCCAVRKKIEKYAYDKLSNEDFKQKFLEIHKTGKKLNFSECKGVTIPESFYLLGIIYNDGMHWKDNEVPIAGKLEHPTIKKMITAI